MTTCPSCGAVSEVAARFCPECGSAFLRTCPACGLAVSTTSKFCESCGTPLDAGEGSEERKLVSILFADVTGSTALGERLDPERLRSILSIYFAAMQETIQTWGGTVEKFVGDAVMAVFGVPAVREDDAERALRAAMEMLGRLRELNVGFQEKHGIELQIRIGVNTGDVIVPVGGPKDQLIVAGDAVNVAARLEQAAEPGSIVVGERTYLVTRNDFSFAEPVPLELKGKTEPVIGRSLVGADRKGGRGIPGLAAEMVGRNRELSTLTGLLEEATETGRPQLITLYGPAGIGKSRLIHEFVTMAAATHGNVAVLTGRCLSAGQGITYWPLAEILRDACGIALDEPAEVAGKKLLSGVRSILTGLELDEEDVRETAFSLATTAGIAIPGNPVDALDPQEVADRLARAWPLFASAHAARGPVLFVIEDLHWASADLLQMIETLVARTEGPVVIAATARPEFAEEHPGFAAGRDDVSSLALRPLTEEQSERLVDSLLRVRDLPEGLQRDILAKAEGNPFFLEEIIRRLIDEGAIVHSGDHWSATPTASVTLLPDTVHALLAARIDGLALEEKRVLQEASVVGRVFWGEPVSRALPNVDVDAALASLERKGLILSRPTSSIAGQREHSFKHALVRDVAYASLPKSRRARANAEVGEWLEELAGERTDEFAELLGHYFGAAITDEDADLAWADDPEEREAIRAKAFAVLLRAGAAARSRFACQKAIELHERAALLVSSDEERLATFEELGDDNEALMHGDASLAAYKSAIELVRDEPGEEERFIRLAYKAARMVERGGTFTSLPDIPPIDELLDRALGLTSDPADRARLLIAKGLLAVPAGAEDPLAEVRFAVTVEGRALAEEIDDPDLVVTALRALGVINWIAGRTKESLAATREMLGYLDRVVSRRERAVILLEVSDAVSLYEGDFEKGLELSRASYEIARDINPHELMHTTHSIMLDQFYLGRWEELRSTLGEHVAAFRSESDVTCPALAGGLLLGAITLTYCGDHAGCDELIELLGPAGEEEMPSRRGWVSIWGARLAAARGDLQAAREVLGPILAGAVHNRADAATALLEVEIEAEDWEAVGAVVRESRLYESSYSPLRPLADRAEGLVALAHDDRESARRFLETSLARYEEMGLAFEAARSRETLAQVVSGPEARDLLKAAIASYRSMGAARFVEGAEDVIASIR